MKIVAALLLVLALGSACGTTGAMVVSTNLHRKDWYRVESRNFEIWSCQSREDSLDLARHLELFRSVAEFVIGERLPRSPLPVMVFAFDGASSARAFGGGALGYFTKNMRRNTIVVGGRGLHRGIDSPILTLQHEYVHYLLFNHADFIYPKWYHEGFAEFLSQVRTEDGADGVRVEIGGIAPGRVPALGGGWMDLDKLLGLQVGDRFTGWGQFYAQSWAFVHYLNFGRTEKRTTQQLTRYLRQIERGSSVDSAIQMAFGMSASELDRDFRRYVRAGKYQSLLVGIENFQVDDHVRTELLEERPVALELADLSLGLGKTQQARLYFDATLAANPDDVKAQVGLAQVDWQAARYDAAETRLSDLVKAHPDDALVHLTLANLLQEKAWRMQDAADEKGEEIDARATGQLARAARRHYVKSWKLDDSVPETYAMYGNTFLLKGQQPRKGLETLHHAHRILPSNNGIRLSLAQIHLRLGNLADARRFAMSIFGSLHSEETLKEIEEILVATGGLRERA